MNRTTLAKFEFLITTKIPDSYLPYCISLFEKYPFEFKVTKKRNTKSGDYRFYPQENRHVVTVNEDLNHWSFLITYLHEVAHRIVKEKHSSRVSPHGTEWKNEFKKVLLPLFIDGNLPRIIEVPLARYCRNPKASTFSDTKLLAALRTFDDAPKITLNDIDEGVRFEFHGKEFKKLEKRRTRIVCQDSRNRKFLIHGSAEVEVVG